MIKCVHHFFATSQSCLPPLLWCQFKQKNFFLNSKSSIYHFLNFVLWQQKIHNKLVWCQKLQNDSLYKELCLIHSFSVLWMQKLRSPLFRTQGWQLFSVYSLLVLRQKNRYKNCRVYIWQMPGPQRKNDGHLHFIGPICQLGPAGRTWKKHQVTWQVLVCPVGPFRRTFSASFSLLVGKGRTFVC